MKPVAVTVRKLQVMWKALMDAAPAANEKFGMTVTIGAELYGLEKTTSCVTFVDRSGIRLILPDSI